MKMELRLAEEFGAFLADGYKASEYRRGRLDPYVSLYQEIVLDFTGIRSANSSFINALVAGAIDQHGPQVLNTLTFKGCNPNVKVLIEAAISLGLAKSSGLSHT